MRRRSKIRHVDGVQVLAIASLFAVCLLILIPFLLMFMSSVTDENTLLVNGYTFFPAEWSTEAYTYVWHLQDRSGFPAVLRALLNSLTRFQEPSGRILTLMIDFGDSEPGIEELWLNSTWWTSTQLLRLDSIIGK